MKPKVYWAVALIVLVLFALFNFLNAETNIPIDELVLLSYIELIILVIGIALFSLKNKFGFYLALLFVACHITVTAFALTTFFFNLPDILGVVQLYHSGPVSEWIFSTLAPLVSLNIGGSIILLVTTLKSKSVFGIKKILHFK
ncbi:MAG: hypothetical protein NTZ73_01225 [Candidatus Diapherotrites archaeon]|nr:hypothetical protein [Candidatus Diapherotrites archaeon]